MDKVYVNICCVQFANVNKHKTIEILLENAVFNDGRSCHRVCDGRIKTCYYEFEVQMYDTMSGYVHKMNIILQQLSQVFDLLLKTESQIVWRL